MTSAETTGPDSADEDQGSLLGDRTFPLEYPGNLKLSQGDLADLLSTLVVVFDDRRAAERLLVTIDYPRGRIPDTQDSGSFWRAIFTDLSNGVVNNPYEQLIRAALQVYPYNSTLDRLADRYGIGVIGTIEVSGPDGRRFRIHDVPARRTVADVAADILDQYPTVDRSVSVDVSRSVGTDAIRLNPKSTLASAGVRDGDVLRLARTPMAGGGFVFPDDGIVVGTNPETRIAHASVVPTSELSGRALGVLRIEIHGSWSVADLIKLLGRLEDGYKAAAALESMAGRPSGSAISSLSSDDVLETVAAFRLAGGLRLGSVRYGSPGFVEVIGALNPLKTVKDGITENREINLKRDEAHRLDERDRDLQEMQHEEAMARESRASEEQRYSHELAAARLRMDAEAARFNMMKELIDRLPSDQQSAAAAQILRVLMGAIEEIANDARVDEARMLEQADGATPA